MIDRLHAARSLLRKQGCSHVLVTDVIDCEYLSGFRASSVFILLSKNQQFLFTDFRYRQAATSFCDHHPEWKFVEITESSFSELSPLVPKGSAIGVQSNSLTVDRYEHLRKACRGSRIVKLSTKITDLFYAKKAPEIRAMSQAARAGDHALHEILPTITLGITEEQVRTRLEAACRSHGSSGPSFETIVLFGDRSALPHGVPSKRRLKRGDWILFDFGCTINGFCSDMTRTFVAGRATTEQKRIYDVVKRAQEKGRASVRPGIAASDVDRVTREQIEHEGFGEKFGHATGHGVGRRIHEGPRVSRKDSTILQEGMVVTVEPGIYLPTFGGVRIEDMVAVTSRGGRVLTHFPRELMELDL